MTLNEETLQFIRKHRRDDVRSLALQAHRYPAIDMTTAITQIAGWQVAKEKVPEWAVCDAILYPAHLSMEQCSSEITAKYKADIVGRQKSACNSFADLTGGFGIDCAFLSAGFRKATYVERQEVLCDIASHNFPHLGLSQISVCREDSIHHLQNMTPVDWIFIDPARRDGHGGKTVAINDCEPNVSALEDLLLEKAKHVLIKLSPMLDLTLALNDLKQVEEVHIISVDNECKELLLVLGHQETIPAEQIPIHCINMVHSGEQQTVTFTRLQEKECSTAYTSELKAFLYEPNASLLKAGAFCSIAHLYQVEKLHPNSHLYTSDHYVSDFPGRKFRITGSSGFNKKELKTLLNTDKKANLTVRNFPASVAELRKRLKLPEGGDTYLFATTLADGKKTLIRCHS